jgi:hypothetical protein
MADGREEFTFTGNPAEDHFGWCPTCGESDGYLNVGRDHWYHCKKHRVRWCVGSNLFDSWRRETEANWDRNWAELESYSEVADPHVPTAAMLQRLYRGCAKGDA